MKKIFMIAAISLGVVLHSFAQQKPYNIVFDLTTSDTATHQRLIRWINGIVTSYPDAKVEVVFYGRALDMIVKDRSTVATHIVKLGTAKKVTFAACEKANDFRLFSFAACSAKCLASSSTSLPLSRSGGR